MKSLHSEVTVRDLERSKRLYGDLVGTVPFQVTSQTRPEGGGDRSVRGRGSVVSPTVNMPSGMLRITDRRRQRTKYGEVNWTGTRRLSENPSSSAEAPFDGQRSMAK